MELRVGRFQLGRKIGSGSNGNVYIGANVKTGEEVAIKLQKIHGMGDSLLREVDIYKTLAGGKGIPKVHWHGEAGKHYALVLDLLGPSLEDLLQYCNKKFNLKTVLMLANQMLHRAEFMHDAGIVHRSIKPENLVIGLGNKANDLHVIDFGGARKYWDKASGRYIRIGDGRVGGVHFASVNAHAGRDYRPRDDLEAIGYVLMYFLRGSLPWQGLRRNSGNRKHLERIRDKKVSTPLEVLCKHFPTEFETYLEYCRNLAADDRPDYQYLRGLFKDLFFREGYQYDFVFEWTIVNYNLKRKKTNDEQKRKKKEKEEEQKPKKKRKPEDEPKPERKGKDEPKPKRKGKYEPKLNRKGKDQLKPKRKMGKDEPKPNKKGRHEPKHKRKKAEDEQKPTNKKSRR